MEEPNAWTREIASLEEGTQEQLGRIFSSLRAELDGAQKAQRDAEEAARTAEARYQDALALKREQYELVIQEIFEKPKKELIKKIAKYSIGGILVTIVATILSINLSLLSYSDARLSSRTIGGAEVVAEVRDRVDELYVHAAASDSGVGQMVRHLEKNKGEFGEYRRQMDLERMYKIRPMESRQYPSGLYYHQYQMAFRLFGVYRVPTSGEMRQWDFEAYRLYDRWYESVQDKGDGKIPRDHRARKWDSFKLEEDGASYNWLYLGPDLTFSQVAEYARRKRDFYSEQANRNVSLTP